MVFWSNVQASWISRGMGWKNLWIPHYDRAYIKYVAHDYMLSGYMKLKFYGDDKLNKTYAYYYDFFLHKTFDQTFLFLKKYNVDFSWLAQAGYLGKLRVLYDRLGARVNTNFFIACGTEHNFINFFFQPQVYYYFFLAWYAKPPFTLHDPFKVTLKNLDYEQQSILTTLAGSLFLSKFIFSTKANFFEYDNFDEIDNFFYSYIPHHISTMSRLYPNVHSIYNDRFWLANLLLNPTILMWYPNFVFYYNSWLHKSWQLSKRRVLQSIKLVQQVYDHSLPITGNLDYFFAKYVWLFFYMREINVFFQGAGAGVGITHELLAQQVAELKLKINLWDTVAYWIEEVWFYLKAYLRYFSYEGKINIKRARSLFKRLFFFQRLIWTMSSGVQFSVPAVVAFIKTHYLSTMKNSFIVALLLICSVTPNFLILWYKFLSKIFYWAIKLVWAIVWVRKLSLFSKFAIIGSIINDFFFTETNYASFLLALFPKSPDFFASSANLNGVFILLFSFLNLSATKNRQGFITKIQANLETNFSTKLTLILEDKDEKFYMNFYKGFNDARRATKYSDWLALAAFWSTLITDFIIYNFQLNAVRRKKFNYFNFILSHFTLKTFFRLFVDLSNVSHFSILLHLVVIYWQNFFFFYLFILKCLKRMYSICSEENLLFLSKPNRTLLQWSWVHTTVLDLFSTSISEFFSLGLNCFKRNLTVGALRATFSLTDLSFTLIHYGKPNCWKFTTENTYVYTGKFSHTEFNNMSPFFVPFVSIMYAAKTFFNKSGLIVHDKKNRLNIQMPFFETRIPTHLIVKHYNNLTLSATLIALFVKKKLEWEHLLAEVLRSLNTLISQASTIRGFMFLLKGRFSRWEWASKIWIKKGRLEQTALWTKLDYCSMPILLKYGTATVWIWLLLENLLNELRAII